MRRYGASGSAFELDVGLFACGPLSHGQSFHFGDIHVQVVHVLAIGEVSRRDERRPEDVVVALHPVAPGKERPDVSNCNTLSRRDVRQVAELAAESMSAGDAPFFLMVNYADAHLPFLRRQEGLPEELLEAADVRPLTWISLNTPRLRQHQAGYYNCLLRLDEGIGMLMDSLERSGQADRTLVIYLADHGA